MNTVKAALIFTWFLQEEPACFSGGSAVLGSLSNLASLGGNHWAPGPFVPGWGGQDCLFTTSYSVLSSPGCSVCHGSFDASALDNQQFFHSYNKHLSAYRVAGTVVGAVSTVGNSTDDTRLCSWG